MVKKPVVEVLPKDKSGVNRTDISPLVEGESSEPALTGQGQQVEGAFVYLPTCSAGSLEFQSLPNGAEQASHP